MRIAENWKEYAVLDTSDGEKLENWNGITLVRPDPQIIWKTPKKSKRMGKGKRSLSSFVFRRRKLDFQRRSS